MQEFKVLWCEDNISNFKNIINKIEKHCEKHNREFVFDHHEYYPKELFVELFTGEYSIMFIDLNLKKGQKGTEIIEMLGEFDAYVDILLYSNNPSELIDLTEGNNYVEGIFRHATMDGIEEKMCYVIDQVLYKENMAITREENYKKS